jgi:hypothetical protein
MEVSGEFQNLTVLVADQGQRSTNPFSAIISSLELMCSPDCELGMSLSKKELSMLATHIMDCVLKSTAGLEEVDPTFCLQMVWPDRAGGPSIGSCIHEDP